MLTIKVKFLIVLVLLAACTSTKKINSNNEIAPIESHTKVMVASIPTARGDKSDLISPRTIENGKLKLVNSHDWTSGFFAGQLWLLYAATGKDEWKQQAESFTAPLEREKTNGTTHDMGFKIYTSFGNGYKLTKDPHFREVIIQSAKTLATRFNPVTGVIKSWDHQEQSGNTR